MSGSLTRLAAIVRIDFLVRFRRVSTVIVFLLLSAFAYVWLPPPSSGRTLIQINDHRAIYNSGAIGMGTASLGMIFVGLFGFYVISNAIRRDVVTRCGLVAASTPMRTGEYLLGKFLGNVLFLTTFLGGFMLTSMAMLLVRGEAPIEPLVFVGQYLLLTPSAVVFVSAVAVLFESIPFLSGKFGDVAYFFFWMAFLGLVVSGKASKNGISWARYFDVTGFGFLMDQMTQTLHTNSLSIGASTFDPKKAPVVFPGLTLTREWVLPRLASTLAPLLFLPLAALFFHRFDPVRTKQTSEKTSRNWIGRLQNLFKPLSRRVVAPLLRPGRGGSFVGAMWSDAALTLTLYPLVLVAFVVITVFSIPANVAHIMPAIFADSRHHRFGCGDAGRAGEHDCESAGRAAPARAFRLVEARVGAASWFLPLCGPDRADGAPWRTAARRLAGWDHFRRGDGDFVRRDDGQSQDFYRRLLEFLVSGGQ